MAWEVQTASSEETVNHLKPTDTVAVQEVFLSIKERGQTQRRQRTEERLRGDSSMSAEQPLRFFSWALGSLRKW